MRERQALSHEARRENAQQFTRDQQKKISRCAGAQQL